MNLVEVYFWVEFVSNLKWNEITNLLDHMFHRDKIWENGILKQSKLSFII